jgi:membrane protein YdbS with pleckstrin-like domain
MGNRLLKVTVILLCCINAAMWEFYTESTLMAVFWAATALAFVIWIADDIRRG